jgi:hypothetical protein
MIAVIIVMAIFGSDKSGRRLDTRQRALRVGDCLSQVAFSPHAL